MANDPSSPTLSAEELLQNIDRLKSDLGVVRNEFDQAVGVWRAIVQGEKQDFQKVLADHEVTWNKEDSEWNTARAGFEQKIQELDQFFNEKLHAMERNAVRALNELDTAWQQERTRWQETVTEQAKTIQENKDLLAASQNEMKIQGDNLTEENKKLQDRLEQVRSIELQLVEWQHEKASWQQTLSERLEELQKAQAAWATERHEKDVIIEALRQENALLVKQNEELDSVEEDKPAVHLYMNTLETQVAALEDFVKQVVFPKRRKSDSLNRPTDHNNSPTSRD